MPSPGSDPQQSRDGRVDILEGAIEKVTPDQVGNRRGAWLLPELGTVSGPELEGGVVVEAAAFSLPTLWVGEPGTAVVETAARNGMRTERSRRTPASAEAVSSAIRRTMFHSVRAK
jgi:hypothetical protein